MRDPRSRKKKPDLGWQAWGRIFFSLKLFFYYKKKMLEKGKEVEVDFQAIGEDERKKKERPVWEKGESYKRDERASAFVILLRPAKCGESVPNAGRVWL